MGQYWIPINLDKKEFVDPHKLGCGLKLWEQLANHPGTGAALVLLCAAQREPRGGGDLANDTQNVIGRWAGDRIALVGDYAEDSDLAPEHKASTLYAKCRAETTIVYNDKPKGAAYQMGHGEHNGKYAHYKVTKKAEYKDISAQVCKVLEKELGGKFSGDGWRTFTRAGEQAAQ